MNNWNFLSLSPHSCSLSSQATPTNSLVVFFKSSFFQWKWKKLLSSHKNLHMDVDCSFIHNCHHGGAITCLLVSEQNNTLWYIQTMEHYSVIKISQLPKVMKTHGWNLNACYYMTTASLKCLHILWYILCDSGRGKAMETLKRSVAARVGEERWVDRAPRIVKVLAILCVV